MTAEDLMVRKFVPPPMPKTPKSAGTRKRLVDVATRLFVDQGYHGVALRDVAGAAGLTKSAVYGHFSSKGQLLVEVIRWKLAESDYAAGVEDDAADLERGVGLMYADSSRELRTLEVDAAAAARHDPDVAAGLAELYGDRLARIRDSMAEVDDAEAAAWLVAALVAGIGATEAVALLPEKERLHRVLVAAMRGAVGHAIGGTQ